MNKKVIEKIVVSQTGINIKDPSRRREVAEARFIYFDMCRRYSDDRSLKAIGISVGRDHASVLHGIKVCKNQNEYDKEFRYRYMNVKTEVEKKHAYFKRFQKTGNIFERVEFLENQLKLLLEIKEQNKQTIKKLEIRVKNLKDGSR